MLHDDAASRKGHYDDGDACLLLDVWNTTDYSSANEVFVKLKSQVEQT